MIDPQQKNDGELGEAFAVNMFMYKCRVPAERIDDYYKRIFNIKSDRSPEKNHKEGDIHVYKPIQKINLLDAQQYYRKLLDIKVTKGGIPTLNLDDNWHKLTTAEYFNGVYHDYYLGIANFNNNPNDINQYVTYTLIKTSEVLNAILDSKNDYLVRPSDKELVHGSRYLSKKIGIYGGADFTYFDSFKDLCPSYFESDNINEILEKIN